MRATGIKKVYTGSWLAMYEIEYKDDLGNTKTYEMVSKVGSKRNPKMLTLDDIGSKSIAVVMAVFNNDMTKILLSKEFRLGVNQYVYSFPAGLREDGESIYDAAKRELYEETGLELVEVERHLFSTFTCAPVTDDITDFIVVRAEGNLRDSDNIIEEIHSEWLSKQEVLNLILSGTVKFAGRAQAFCYLWAASNEIDW